MVIYKYSKKEAQKNKYNDAIAFHPGSYVLMPIMLTFTVFISIWLFIPVLRTNIIYPFVTGITEITIVVMLLREYIKKESWCRTVFVIYKKKLYMIKRISSFNEGFFRDAIFEYEENGYSEMADVTRLYGAVLHKDSRNTLWCEYDDYDEGVQCIEIPKAYPGLKRVLDRGYSGAEQYIDYFSLQ